MNFKKWQWLVAVILPCVTLATLFLFNVLRVNFEAETVLAYKGVVKQLPRVSAGRVERGATTGQIRLIGQGQTPAQAVQSAQTAAATLTQTSLDQKKSAMRKRLVALQSRQKTISTRESVLNQQRQYAAQGSRQVFTPAMATRLNEARGRHRTLVTHYPTHTDIPILAQQIKSMEAIQRGTTKVDRNRVGQLAQQINEARAEWSLVQTRVRALEQTEKRLQSDWTVVKAAVKPSTPVNMPGWPIAAGAATLSAGIGFFLIKRGRKNADATGSGLFAPGRVAVPTPVGPVSKIPLELATDETAALPDDPQSRKAAALYERWLELVKTVYATGPEAPKDIFANTEPLYKETVAFLGEGQDIMTRHLARVVVPGDLMSHVARTALIALIGAYEAGASTVQQQGMTFAALFHDLAVAPRPAHAWHEIGSEVGRLSSGLLRKIPGIPAPLLSMIEDILVSMDEYPTDTWQNVPRNTEVASFAKLLGQIDRFDKVMQKQKSRLARRIA